MNYILVIFPDLYVALLTYKFDVPTLDMYFFLIVYCIAFKLQTLCYYLIVLTCKGRIHNCSVKIRNIRLRVHLRFLTMALGSGDIQIADWVGVASLVWCSPFPLANENGDWTCYSKRVGTDLLQQACRSI